MRNQEVAEMQIRGGILADEMGECTGLIFFAMTV